MVPIGRICFKVNSFGIRSLISPDQHVWFWIDHSCRNRIWSLVGTRRWKILNRCKHCGHWETIHHCLRTGYTVKQAPETNTILWRTAPQIAKGINFISSQTFLCALLWRSIKNITIKGRENNSPCNRMPNLVKGNSRCLVDLSVFPVWCLIRGYKSFIFLNIGRSITFNPHILSFENKPMNRREDFRVSSVTRVLCTGT